MLNWRNKDEAAGQGPTLGQVLINEGLATEEQVAAGHAVAEKSGTFLGHALVVEGVIEQKDLVSCLVKVCKIPHLSLLDYEIGDDLVELVSRETCQKYHLLPIDKMGKILTVAMVDPLDQEALETVRAACPELKIKPILCDWDHYRVVAERVLGGGAGGTPSNEVSMQSLGLSGATAAKKKPAPKPVPEETSAPAVPPASAQPTAPVTGGASGQEIAQAVKSAMDESFAALITHLQQAPASQSESAATAGMTAEELAGALQNGVKEAVQEALSAFRESSAATPPPADEKPTPAVTPLSAEDIANAIKSAMEDSMAGLASRMETPAPEPQPENVTPFPHGMQLEELTSSLQSGFRDAMQEALVAFRKEIDEGKESGGGDLNATIQESVTHAVQQAVTSISEEMKGPDGGGLKEAAEQIMRAAEAAIEATSAAAALRSATQEDSEREHREKLQRFNTVQPFGQEEPETDADTRVSRMLDADCPLEGFAFDNFCASKENEFPLKMCSAIAQAPGSEYNPFFLHGPVGVGKTHLINAIGNVICHDQGGRVGYVSAGRFADRLMEAKQNDASAYFREAYSHWDVLILDDIQFLSGHIDAQEEFFHIFNALVQANRQVIIAADRGPKDLGHLEQRLVSRFASGIVAPLQPPDHTTRVTILRQQATMLDTPVSDDALAVIATRIPNDVRQMTGCLRKVIAFARTVGQDINSELADQVLSHVGAA